MGPGAAPRHRQPGPTPTPRPRRCPLKHPGTAGCGGVPVLPSRISAWPNSDAERNTCEAVGKKRNEGTAELSVGKMRQTEDHKKALILPNGQIIIAKALALKKHIATLSPW